MIQQEALMTTYNDLIGRNPDTPDRKSNALTIINLTDDDNEAQVAVLHPDGQVVVLTVKAHRGTLTVISPKPVVVKKLEDSGEVAVSWRTEWGLEPESHPGVAGTSRTSVRGQTPHRSCPPESF
jgi:hypothetical protein